MVKNIEKNKGILFLIQYCRIYPLIAMKDLSADNNLEEWALFFNPSFYHNDVDHSHRSQSWLFLQISNRISPTMTQVTASPGLGKRWAKTQSKAVWLDCHSRNIKRYTTKPRHKLNQKYQCIYMLKKFKHSLDNTQLVSAIFFSHQFNNYSNKHLISTGKDISNISIKMFD